METTAINAYNFHCKTGVQIVQLHKPVSKAPKIN